MSMTFFVKNKKKLFGGYAPDMVVDEILSISPNISQFSFDESAQDFDVESFYNSQISSYECLLLGIDGVSGRGFEVGFSQDEQSYNVRIYTPSTKNDWKIALEYIKNLSIKLGSKIVNEYGDEFNDKNIEDFNYEDDILAGLRAMQNHLGKEDMGNNITYGIYNPVAFNKKMIDEILNSDEPVEEFSKFVTDIQNIDAYWAKQRFYKDNNSENIFGSYALTQGLPTVLPFKPSVEFDNINIVENQDVNNWEISLVGVDGDEDDFDSYKVLSVLNYNDFIENLPKDKYKFIDANYILIQALSKSEFEDIIFKINKHKD